MKTLFVLLIGAVLGVMAYQYFKEPQKRPVMEQTADSLSDGAEKVRDKLSQNFPDLDADDIKAELERSGRVIRKKAEKAGVAIKDATADARITAEIKGRYALTSELSSLRISVNTTDGIVTLSGSAPSAEDVSKAMRIALETEGVQEVVSTIQVKLQNN
jgi:osmotically-inducible protein OsmY